MSGKRSKVLIVHIDEYALIGLEQMLEDLGFQTTTAWDSHEAVRLLHASSFDLVLIGDRPPVVNASELAPHIPAHTQTVVLRADTSFMSACLDQVRGRGGLTNCA
jgi:CheY-like chemotaxis protein